MKYLFVTHIQLTIGKVLMCDQTNIYRINQKHKLVLCAMRHIFTCQMVSKNLCNVGDLSSIKSCQKNGFF